MSAEISASPRCSIIAEAGVNHGGSTDAALELVDAAAAAGADAVKFQSFRTELLVHQSAPQAAYQQRNAPAPSQAEMLRALELSPAAHHRIAERCAEREIEFLSTPFDAPSLDLLLGLGVHRLKVASGELTNGPMLLRMARTGLPLIVSTGMATLEEVAEALAVIRFGRMHAEGVPDAADLKALHEPSRGSVHDVGDVTLLHCTSSYPAPPASVHLRAMTLLQERFGLPVGYSDHTEGIVVAIAAVARGAQVIEKHLTLSRALPGPDHAASLEPDEMAELVRSIRMTESALGEDTKGPSSEESDVRSVARRSLYAARDLDPSVPLGDDDLVALRPGRATMPPSELWHWLGRRPSRTYQVGDPFEG